ncbi:hypothetical protein IQ254_21060 [Nodosilinea sp. LEGE 07088]|uniref:hypothetical protein n=1 Tax=Nodosilinea sp. LEGE 07088 TaxID=2777968 RepID=UPI0018830BDC|nr:hypothetical protein [Nodosilinea sp. LEGE 07088]MBE9139656.1 hypothetical protein [Nodosilinea sp. LEGE 07088]
MMPKETKNLAPKLASRFLGGAALGAVLVALPLTYSSPLGLDGMLMAKVSFVVVVCGLMSMVWGAKLINAVMEALAKTGL